MPNPANIFEKVRLQPAQLRTVADRRFVDANYLRNSGENKHANGAMYLAGFVIECLLKARLLVKHPELCLRTSLQTKLHRLLYQSHNLELILAELPEVQSSLRPSQLTSLKSICASWTIFARYSPRMANVADANRFLDQVKELKQWLN